MNSVIIIGRMVKDPELRYSQAGLAISRFTIAVDKGLSKEKKREMESNNQQTADFISVVTFNKQAENAANYLVKGRLVGIQGRIQTSNYDDKDGKKVYVTEVVASNIEFLEFRDKKDKDNSDFGGVDGFKEVDMGDIPF